MFDSKKFEWYKGVFNSLLRKDMGDPAVLNDVFQLLLNMDSDIGFDDIPVRKYAMKISRYAHDMARYAQATCGEEIYEELYYKFLLLEAQNQQVDSGLLYLEKNRLPKERFYEPRRSVFMKHEIIQSLQALMDDDLDIFALSLPPGTGKALADDTPVLTKDGWKNHGDLRPGDYVLGLDGKFKKVIRVFPKGMEDMLVTFSNGEKILCNKHHEWVLRRKEERKNRIFETIDLFKSKLEKQPYGTEKDRYIYWLPKRRPYVGTWEELPVSPYAFGAWLGDSKNTDPVLKINDMDSGMLDEVQKSYTVTKAEKRSGYGIYRFDELGKDLQQNGISEKKIPVKYLLADSWQRLDLLAGLLDSNGTLDKNEHKDAIIERAKGIAKQQSGVNEDILKNYIGR